MAEHEASRRMALAVGGARRRAYAFGDKDDHGRLSMEAIKLLFSSDYGLASLGVIVFTIVMGAYIGRHVKKLMNEKPGTEGWQ